MIDTLTHDLLSHNLLSWIVQIVVLALAGAILPLVLRVRHPRTQLVYCHLLLVVCLLLPLAEPWLHPTVEIGSAEVALPEAVAPSAAGVAQPQASIAPGSPTPQMVARPVEPTWTGWTSARVLISILAVGAVLRLSWLVVGLLRIRQYRIGATPLYPIPESIQAASSITHADALFCISPQVSGPVMLGWLSPVVLLPESFWN